MIDRVEWIATIASRVAAKENELAKELGLAPGELLLDYPTKTQMLGLDIPVLRRSGKVERLTGEGWLGTINLPSLVGGALQECEDGCGCSPRSGRSSIPAGSGSRWNDRPDRAL